MRRHNFLVALTLSVLVVATVHAQEAVFSGELSTMWGVLAPGTMDAGDFSCGNTTFTATLDAYTGNSSLLLKGDAGFDAHTGNFFCNIAEAWADYSDSIWGIRLGRQKIVWGKADGVSITNSVFPEDLTTLFLEDSTLAVDAVRLSFFHEYFTADAYWIPFFRGTKLPLEEGNPLRQFLVPAGVNGIPVSLGNLKKPDLSLKNAEYGIKLGGYFPFCDVSLYGFHGWDKTPALEYSLGQGETGNPTEIRVGGEYKRISMLGLDAAFPVGETVLRLECAFFPRRHVQASAEKILSGGDTTERRNQVSCLAGIDWMPSGWTITAQYYFQNTFGDLSALEQTEVFTHGATLSIAKTMLSDTLELSLSAMVGLNDFDSAIVSAATYSLTDALKGELGAYVFLPGVDGNGTYGTYKNLSTIYLNMKYSF